MNEKRVVVYVCEKEKKKEGWVEKKKKKTKQRERKLDVIGDCEIFSVWMTSERLCRAVYHLKKFRYGCFD